MLAPQMCQYAIPPKVGRARGLFPIVHSAQDGHHGAPVAVYRKQTVEIVLGPKGTFDNGNIGTITRRVVSLREVPTRAPPA